MMPCSEALVAVSSHTMSFHSVGMAVWPKAKRTLIGLLEIGPLWIKCQLWVPRRWLRVIRRQVRTPTIGTLTWTKWARQNIGQPTRAASTQELLEETTVVPWSLWRSFTRSIGARSSHAVHQLSSERCCVC